MMFSTRRRPFATLAAAAAVAACAVFAQPSANAASSDRSPNGRSTAMVRVAEGYYPVTRAAGPYVAASEPCSVRLHRRGGTTALDALEMARERGCVSSYVVEQTAAGPYLRCVNGRCEAVGFYWAIYLNAVLTCDGIGDIVLARDDELTLSFEAYPTALALVSCV